MVRVLVGCFGLFIAAKLNAQSIEDMRKMDTPECVEACMFRAIQDNSCKSLPQCADQCEGVCRKETVDDAEISVVKNVLVAQNLPITMTSYDTRPKDSDRDGKYDGVIHSIRYVNPDSTRKLEAIEVTFILFDVWNEHITTVEGSHMSRLAKMRLENAMSAVEDAVLDAQDRRTWDAAWTHDLGPTATERLWTAVAYISKIRFEDGRVLESDQREVERALVGEGLITKDVEAEEVESITTKRI